MNTATLVIAVVGLGLSVLSLGWQAASFFLSGPRVRVHLQEGFRGMGGAVLAPPSVYTDQGREALERQGFTEHILAVIVVNRGRLPATVGNWSIRFGNGAAYQNPGDPRNPALPYRLEPFTSESWYAPVDHLQKLQEVFTDQSETAAHVRGVIDLGSRETLASQDALILGPDGVRMPTPRLIVRARRRLGR